MSFGETLIKIWCGCYDYFTALITMILCGFVINHVYGVSQETKYVLLFIVFFGTIIYTRLRVGDVE